MTISDMQLRTLILQPGAVFLHFTSFLGTWGTWIGGLSTLAAVASIFYTTASDALVQPKLALTTWAYDDMTSMTQTNWADRDFIYGQCQTPISESSDARASTICTELEHSGQAYHNFIQYLASYNVSVDAKNVSASDMDKRPGPVAMLFDNTTVQGVWAEPIDMAKAEKENGRIINNVTMRIPHAGVFGAAKLVDNGLPSPQLSVHPPASPFYAR